MVTGQTVMCGSGVGRPRLCLTLSADRSWPSYHGAKFGSRGPHGLMGEFRNLGRRTEVRTRPNDLRTRVRLGAEGTGSSHLPHRGPCPALGATDGTCLLCRGLPEAATPPGLPWSDCRLFRGLAQGPAPPVHVHARSHGQRSHGQHAAPELCGLALARGALRPQPLAARAPWQTVLSHRHQGDTRDSPQEARRPPKCLQRRAPPCGLPAASSPGS